MPYKILKLSPTEKDTIYRSFLSNADVGSNGRPTISPDKKDAILGFIEQLLNTAYCMGKKEKG